MRRLYFPLRSSVELFEDATSIATSVRAKEGAVLFDEVFFESGMVIANLGENANFVIYRPRHELGPDDFADTRNPAAPGEEFVIAVGTPTAPGASAEALRPILQTKTVKSYAAEWHSSAIDELASLGVEWAKFGSLDKEEMDKLAKPIEQATSLFQEQAAKLSLPPVSCRLRIEGAGPGRCGSGSNRGRDKRNFSVLAARRTVQPRDKRNGDRCTGVPDSER